MRWKVFGVVFIAFFFSSLVKAQKASKIKKDGLVEIAFKQSEDVMGILQLNDGGFLLKVGKGREYKNGAKLYSFSKNLNAQWKVSLPDPNKSVMFNCLVAGSQSSYVYHITSETKLPNGIMRIEPLKVSRINSSGQKETIKCRTFKSKFENEMPIAFFQNEDNLFYVSIQWTEPIFFMRNASKSELIKASWKREIKFFTMAHDQKEFKEQSLNIPIANWNVPILANISFLANDETGFYLGRKEMMNSGEKVKQVVYHISYEGKIIDSSVFNFELSNPILPVVNLNHFTEAYSFDNGVLDLTSNSAFKGAYTVHGYHISGAYKDDYAAASAIVTQNAFGATYLDLEAQELWFYGLCIKSEKRYKSVVSYNFLCVSSEDYNGIGVPFNQVFLMKYDLKSGKLKEVLYKDVPITKDQKKEVDMRASYAKTFKNSGLGFYGIELYLDSVLNPQVYTVGRNWVTRFGFDFKNKIVTTKSISIKNKFSTSVLRGELENELHHGYLMLDSAENNPYLNNIMKGFNGNYKNRRKSVFCIRNNSHLFLFENSAYGLKPKLKISRLNRFKI